MTPLRPAILLRAALAAALVVLAMTGMGASAARAATTAANWDRAEQNVVLRAHLMAGGPRGFDGGRALRSSDLRLDRQSRSRVGGRSATPERSRSPKQTD